MADTAPRTGEPIWLIPFVVASALFMENLDSSAIATALPVIARDLGQDPVILKLALTSYLLSLAIFIPISGWCADRFGARPLFQAAIVIFVISSVACGAAQSLEHLIVARALQGIGGAMMVPVGRLIVLRSVPKGQLVQALAYLTVPALVAPMLGPPLGGFVTTYVDWRWIFWINVPIGCVGLALAQRYMPNVRAANMRRFDFVGFALAGFGLSTLIFGFTVAGREFLPAHVATLLMLAGIVSCGAYVMHARKVDAPLIDLELLRIATFRTSVVGGGLFRLGIGAIPFLLPLMLQEAFGMTAMQSGLVTFTGAFGALLMKITAAPILRRYGFRNVLGYNALVCGALLGTYALFTPSTPAVVMALVLFVGGFFRSLQFTSLNAVAYSDIPEDMMSRATAFVAVAQQFFLSAGVALAAFILELARSWRGDDALVAADFSIAFLLVASLTGAAAILHLKLPRDAGAQVSGHRTV